MIVSARRISDHSDDSKQRDRQPVSAIARATSPNKKGKRKNIIINLYILYTLDNLNEKRNRLGG